MGELLDIGHGISVSDAFCRAMQRLRSQLSPSEQDFIPNIDWVYFKSGSNAGTYNWALNFHSRSWMLPENLISIKDFQLHITPGNRDRLRNKIIHFTENRLEVLSSEGFSRHGKQSSPTSS